MIRNHINAKWKKQQKESERCKKIEKENQLLLKKMNYIMKTSRVDNNWTTPQPRFLNRIPMYDILIPKIEYLTIEESDTEGRSRKEKCYACSKNISFNQPLHFEKQHVRSKSVPVRREFDLPPIKETNLEKKPKPRAKTSLPIKKHIPFQPNCIILNRGSLELSVNFPSDTSVKYQQGTKDRFLIRNECNCKNTPIRCSTLA